MSGAEPVDAVRFVSCRPRYPVGAPVPGFPAIGAVLYADPDCEVYRLEQGRGSDLLLVVARDAPDLPTFAQQRAWIERHGCEVLACPKMSSGAQHCAVRVHGSWMAEIPTQPMNEHELYALLIGLVNLATDAADADLSAAPIRPLLWIEGPIDVQRLTSVYVRAAAAREAEVVRQIGQTFLWAATGISSVEMESVPDDDRFLSWCQNADAGLANVISRCLGPRDTITTLYELRREVGSAFMRLGESRSADERTDNRYVNLGPQRYLWFTKPLRGGSK
jgi:hypothetical protein